MASLRIDRPMLDVGPTDRPGDAQRRFARAVRAEAAYLRALSRDLRLTGLDVVLPLAPDVGSALPERSVD